jgi:hypothetical protein
VGAKWREFIAGGHQVGRNLSVEQSRVNEFLVQSPSCLVIQYD